MFVYPRQKPPPNGFGDNILYMVDIVHSVCGMYRSAVTVRGWGVYIGKYVQNEWPRVEINSRG